MFSRRSFPLIKAADDGSIGGWYNLRPARRRYSGGASGSLARAAAATSPAPGTFSMSRLLHCSLHFMALELLSGISRQDPFSDIRTPRGDLAPSRSEGRR